MASRTTWLWCLSILYALVGLCIYVFLVRAQFDGALLRFGTDYGDASQYNAVAVNLLEKGMYSLDGTTPFFEREPGYILFLAAAYKLFGLDTYGMVFLLQGLLYLAAVLSFERVMRRIVPPRAALLTTGILLLSPAAFHSVFAILRESLSLSLALLFMSFTYEAWLRRSPLFAVLAGACLGYLILTYAALLLLPFFVIAALVLLKFSWKHGVLMMVTAIVVIAPWGMRNYSYKGELCLTGCYRAALQWYVRGEQAETLRGLEPLRCLEAEYLTRNYEGRHPNCHFNAVWHRKWPEGFYPTPEDRLIGKAGQGKILANFPHYLWQSAAEVLELHLPYVNGWGRGYNVLAALWTLLLYVGCAAALPFLRQRFYALPLLLMAYFIGIFALTDALPRYLVPALLAYALLAGVGYDRLLSRVFHAFGQHRHSGV